MSEVMNLKAEGYSETFGSGEVTGSGVVTSVDQETKTVTLDPVHVEKIMVERELKRQQQQDPVEIASMMLTIYTPRFTALVDKLSARALRRVTKSIVAYPVGKEYKHNDPLEREAFQLGCALADAKQVLVINTYSDNAERIIQEAATAAANTTIETEFGVVPEDMKEEANG